MSLDQKDLQILKGMMEEQTTVILTRVEVLVDKKLEQHSKSILSQVREMQLQQTKDICEVINQALSAVDEQFATKAELAEVRQEVFQLKRAVALG